MNTIRNDNSNHDNIRPKWKATHQLKSIIKYQLILNPNNCSAIVSRNGGLSRDPILQD